jgi:2-desacetyl-2-hydroxyethyl bacteriochlorophyllide A dehydrogenase
LSGYPLPTLVIDAYTGLPDCLQMQAFSVHRRGRDSLSAGAGNPARLQWAAMNAVQLVAHGQPGRLLYAEMPDPVPVANEVVVRVTACGLNRLDLWVEEGRLPIPIQLPLVPGCEIAGCIETKGAELEGWQVGDRVAVQSNVFCGRCEFCGQGNESLCLHGALLGVQRHGGFAELVNVPVQALVRLPETVDERMAAALTLAGSTAMHMLTTRAQVKSGDWVLVLGAASGVGSAAIQIAQRLGARVITTGSTQAKRELGLRLGAEYALDAAETNWPGEVRRITGKRGVDLAIEHVGGQVLERVFHCLARGGTVVTCGATAGREVRLNLWPLFVKEQRLIGSYGRNRADLIRTLDWAAQGWLKPVIDRVCSLPEIRRAYDALRAREVMGKVVVRMP